MDSPENLPKRGWKLTCFLRTGQVEHDDRDHGRTRTFNCIYFRIVISSNSPICNVNLRWVTYHPLTSTTRPSFDPILSESLPFKASPPSSPNRSQSFDTILIQSISLIQHQLLPTPPHPLNPIFPIPLSHSTPFSLNPSHSSNANLSQSIPFSPSHSFNPISLQPPHLSNPNSSQSISLNHSHLFNANFSQSLSVIQ